ncbi:hypothetical protein GCM10017783_06020 [Deinococcus piscis]|uniref:Uncharacterized protein n=1 Tax=Deinococcus piscis TaxID=394230 RepID=A0ABQ3K2B5_9DEIO|nr:hypothetical protein [Deinococcus piscis]GHF97035.1 hypothetical protein GCM10017783_06020 [Deinococcus piscis]
MSNALELGWDTVKHVMGGQFIPALWYVRPGHTVLDIGGTRCLENRHLYRLCAAHSVQYSRAELVALAEAALIDHDQDSVLHVVATEAEVPALQAQGYVVSAQEVYYDALP